MREIQGTDFGFVEKGTKLVFVINFLIQTATLINVFYEFLADCREDLNEVEEIYFQKRLEKLN